MSLQRSLRVKLTIWYLVIFGVLQGGAVLLAFRQESGSFEDTYKAHVIRKAGEMVDNITTTEILDEPDLWSDKRLRDLIPVDSGFAVFLIRDTTHEVILEWDVNNTDLIPFGQDEIQPSGPVGPTFRDLPPQRAQEFGGTTELRLLTVPFRIAESDYYLQAVVPNRFARESLGPFTSAIIMLPIGLALALFAGWLIAGRAVSPIQELSVAAKAVSPKRIGGRLQLETRDGEVSALQAELNSALERLENGYRGQEEFISNVSHELKTPIAVLLTESQVVGLGEESLEKYRAYATRVKEEMQALGRLVESFLTLARSDLGLDRALREAVPINDVVLDSVQHCRAFAERHGVRLVPNLASPHGDDDGEVAGDTELLRTMLDNLIRNAVRFSPAGAPVSIDVTDDGQAIRIRVSDRGPGIPEDYLERIFDRYVQVPDDSSRGTGLGLTIARNVALLHGGSISVVNNHDVGCAFTIELPRAPQSSPQTDAEPTSTSARG